MKNTLISGFTQMNINVNAYQLEQFLRYYEVLIDYNTKVNLTNITQPDDVCKKHFLDSAALLCVHDIPQGAALIDVGTGAGFPGIPLKILRPDIQLTLLDSLNKRVEFLKLCVSELGLDNVQCVHARAEESARNKIYREKFDITVSRAVANMSTLCEYCLPYTAVGGVFAAYKGPAVLTEQGGELDTAKNALNLLGGGDVRLKNVDIPDSGLSHCIVLVDKIQPTPPQYPRSGGKPTNKPIK